MIHIILDTSVLCSDFTLSGNAFTITVDFLSKGGCRLCIPQVVVDETVNVYRSQLGSCSTKIANELRHVKRLTGHDTPNPVDESQVQNLADEYDQSLRSKLNTIGAEVLPYPDVSHEVTAKRAIARKKPFSESGGGVTGYRDYLIWRSVLDIAQYAPDDDSIAFVSRNVRDFASEGHLHSDLLADLSEEGIEPEMVVFCSSLDELVDKVIKPLLPYEETIRRELAQGRYRNLDLANALDEAAFLLTGQELDPNDIWVSTVLESPTISHIEDISDLEVRDVRVLAPDKLVIDVAFKASCSFDAFVMKSDYYVNRLDESDTVRVEHADWNDYYMMVSTDESVEIEARGTADVARGALTSLKVTSVHGPDV